MSNLCLKKKLNIKYIINKNLEIKIKHQYNKNIKISNFLMNLFLLYE